MYQMCGRYTDTRRDKKILVQLHCQGDLEFTPRYNIAPTQDASIVALGADGTPEHKRARWGLLPVWTKSSAIPASLINARAETVATKPSFQHAYKKRRCLVLADGFYEWMKGPGGKQPMYFRLREHQPFAFGGLWEEWRDEERLVESFCVITVPPNELCATVHDRMPLILREADFAAWMDHTARRDLVDALLKPYDAAAMEVFPVGEFVNHARNEGEVCIQRVDAAPIPSKAARKDEAKGQLRFF